MKKTTIIVIFLCFVLWLFIKPSKPSYIKVIGQVVDFDSNEPISDANVKIFRFFNTGNLWSFLKYSYLREEKIATTNSLGQFNFNKIIKVSKIGNNIRSGDIEITKKGYISFYYQILDPAPIPSEFQIRLKKQYMGFKLPQGLIRYKIPTRSDKKYINFPNNKVSNEKATADLILDFYEVTTNIIPETSQRLGSYRSLSGTSIILKRLQVQENGGIAAIPIQEGGRLVNSFEELASCSELEYKEYVEYPPPSVYCIRTKDGNHYAKIYLENNGRLCWIYQPDSSTDVESELTSLKRWLK
ncbi:MAG: hypothetical protein P9X22_02530 [Candidatus Zapsychrus exili]|nr:hypothetical protein [Candidatus Zapsychrus exili]